MVNDGIWTKFPRVWARGLATIPTGLYKHFHLIKNMSYITNCKLDDTIQIWRALATFQVVRKYFVNKKWRSVGMYITAGSINWHVWQPIDNEGCRGIIRLSDVLIISDTNPCKASYYECAKFTSHFETSVHRDLYSRPEELTRATT